MKSITLKLNSLLSLTTAAVIISTAYSQAPVRDDDIQGQLELKSDLAVGDKVVALPGNYRNKNMMVLIENSPRFTILRKMLEATGVNSLLKDATDTTFFAPTDEAFEKMGEEEIEAMMADKNIKNLKRLLRFHATPSILTARMLTEPIEIATRAGEDLAVTTRVDDGDVVIVVGGLAKVIQPDINVKNGVVHAIDRVLFPRRNAEEE